MKIETLIDVGIPLLVTLITYLCIRWASQNATNPEELIDSEPLIHQGYEPKV